jgi:hypothetical protein
MLTDDPEKRAAALERLEAERERRISEKIESGEAIRVPLPLIGPPELFDGIRAAKLAQLRNEGERREVLFDETEIITGVPRAPDGYYRGGGGYAPGASVRDQAPPDGHGHNGDAGAANAAPVEDSAPRLVYAQVEQPCESNPGGSIVEGWFHITDGVLHLQDMQERPLASQPLTAGDDPARVARKLLRAKLGDDFHRPIAPRSRPH